MLTFINKDSTSSNVARSTPSERRLINEQSREHRASARTASTKAHIHLHQRRRPSEIRTRSDHVSHQATYQNSAANTNTNDTNVFPEQSTLTPSTPTIATSSKSFLESLRSRPSTLSTDESTTISTLTSGIVAAPIPLGNPIDPFQTTDLSGSFTPTVLHLITYYKQVYYSTLWTTIFKALAPFLSNAPVTIPRCTPDKVIYDALQNRNRMSCLLANTGSHMTVNNPMSTAQETVLTNLQLLHEGTTSLRHEMASKSLRADNDILVSAMHLCLAATRIGKEDAARAHLKGVRAIVEGILSGGGSVSIANLGVLSLVDRALAIDLLTRKEESEANVEVKWRAWNEDGMASRRFVEVV